MVIAPLLCARRHWPTGPGEYAGEWLGWSPGGRYIGLRAWGPRLTTIDVRTGRIKLISVPNDTRPRPSGLPAVLNAAW